MTSQEAARSGNGRPTLSRQSILQAALALIDEEGVGGFTMRELSSRMGYTDMALYKYVASRDEVVDGVLDQLLGTVTLPGAEEGDWEARLAAVMRSLFALFRAHPHTLPALLERPLHLPAIAQTYEAARGMLAAADFDEAAIATITAALSSYTLGYVTLLCGGFFTQVRPPVPEPTRSRRRRSKRCPALLTECDWDVLGSRFDAGLTAILSGLRTTQGRGTSPAATAPGAGPTFPQVMS
jgi:AcrR family transcriptional regulator